VRIAFLLPKIQLAGGIHIVLEHARGLAARHGHEVVIFLTRSQVIEHEFASLADVDCRSIDEASGESFDIAIGTWWETAYSFPRVEAERYAHFVQNLEDRFYRVTEIASRAGASLVQALPVTYITPSGWLQRQLQALRPDVQTHCVLSGMDKQVFGIKRPAPTDAAEPLRIVIEGPADVWFKGVPDALESVERMKEPRHLTVIAGDRPPTSKIKSLADRIEGQLSHQGVADVLGRSHVLLKLSRVEGMAGPPLEAFHRGATAVLSPVTGHDEYALHGENCQIVGFDDITGTARTLDLLARDRELLHHLRSNAAATAERWPGWEHSTGRFDRVLQEIVAAPAPASRDFTRQMILEREAILVQQLALESALIARGWYAVDSDHSLARPGFFGRVLWVARHEGARGIAFRILKRVRAPLAAVGSLAAWRLRALRHRARSAAGDFGER
jgi:glycosyltransferase involved in cell wall biosynthesis